MTSLKQLPIILLASLLTACSVGPNYVRPSVAVPAQYKEANKNWQQAKPQDANDRGHWWAIFNNPELNALETRVNISNQNIALAEAQYRQAQALASQARAAYFPTIGASANITRQQRSLVSGDSNTSGSSTSQTNEPNNDYLLSGNASWELDLWGAVRRQVESSTASVQASAAQVASVRLSTQALLAQNYFQLRALDKVQRVLNEAVSAYQKSLKLTQDRFNSGVATRSETAQAQTELNVAQAAAIDNGVNRAQLEHAIAVLVGQAPGNFSLAPKIIALQPPNIPSQMPSTLLERRPDIAEAERNMAAANAQIGVAIAAYFPTFSLSGAAGYESNNFAHWITQPTLFWSVGPQLALTLFDGGLRHAKTAAARASYDQSVAAYRQTVLSAFQNVEDNLSTLRILSRESKAQQQAVRAAMLSLKMALDNYKSGTTAFTDVIIAQTAAYTAQQNAVAVTGRQMVAAVGLVTALGGGWRGEM